MMEQRELEQQAFSLKMKTYTQSFAQAEYLTPEALYVLASIGGNTQTIPFIPFPEDFDAQRGLAMLTPAYIQDEILTELAREVIVAIAWMQKSRYTAIINEASFFYEKDGLPVSVVVSDETQTRLRIAHRYKTAELLSVLGAFSWMNQPLNKTERLSLQTAQVKDIIERFEGVQNVGVSLYEKGKVIYNSIFFDHDGGVVKYDAMKETIEEQSGRLWLKELMKQLHVNQEFGFDSVNQRRGF